MTRKSYSFEYVIPEIRRDLLSGHHVAMHRDYFEMAAGSERDEEVARIASEVAALLGCHWQVFQASRDHFIKFIPIEAELIMKS